MKKRIIKNIILLFFPIGFAFLVLNFAYKNTNHWKHRDNNAYRFKQVPMGIKLCNVGSSHGMCSFKWEDYPGLNAFNFGVSAQPYWLDLVMLKHFEKNIEKGATVIIPLSCFQVYSVATVHEVVYYHFLSHKEYSDWNLHDYILSQILPPFFPSSLKHLIKDIPKEEITRFSDWENIRSKDEIIEIADRKIKDHFYENFKNDNYKKNMEDVCKLVEYCLQKEYVPIFVTTPLYSLYNEILENDAAFFKKEFNRFLKELRQKFPTIPYFDYSNDKEFSPNLELFKDSDHLNVYGAEAFTKRVIKDLKQAGYLE